MHQHSGALLHPARPGPRSPQQEKPKRPNAPFFRQRKLRAGTRRLTGEVLSARLNRLDEKATGGGVPMDGADEVLHGGSWDRLIRSWNGFTMSHAGAPNHAGSGTGAQSQQ